MSNPLALALTQADFGRLVGVSQPAVSALIERGTLSPGATADQWLLEYCGNLREVSAGRLASGDLDLAEQRARLAFEQANRVEMQNAITRREYAPLGVLVELISGAAAQIGVIFDALPGKIRREVPGLPSTALDAIARELAKGRNAIADMKIEDVLADAPAPELKLNDITEIE